MPQKNAGRKVPAAAKCRVSLLPTIRPDRIVSSLTWQPPKRIGHMLGDFDRVAAAKFGVRGGKTAPQQQQVRPPAPTLECDFKRTGSALSAHTRQRHTAAAAFTCAAATTAALNSQRFRYLSLALYSKSNSLAGWFLKMKVATLICICLYTLGRCWDYSIKSMTGDSEILNYCRAGH